jgi:hypothetical protein
MKASWPLVALVGLALVAVSSPSSAANPSVTYSLGNTSSLWAGCLAPCECAVRSQERLSGTFRLEDAGFDGTFQQYRVVDVDWIRTAGDVDFDLTGSGTYRVAGDRQQLVIDLVDSGHSLRLDSGLTGGGSSFPQIRLPIALNGFYCNDVVAGVDASPTDPVVYPAGPPVFAFRLGPNPFRGSATIDLSLPKDGLIDLRVHDLAGREVRRLAASRFTAGPHSLTWDGRDAHGARVPAGIYFVRLRTADRESRQTIVKLQ